MAIGLAGHRTRDIFVLVNVLALFCRARSANRVFIAHYFKGYCLRVYKGTVLTVFIVL
jgi:hypothetical protein